MIYRILILISLLLTALIALPFATSYVSGSGLLRIKYPDQNATVAANNFIVVNGTSAASNSTHTHCNVQLQINQDGYNSVRPTGANATYTNWTTTSKEMMKVGHNEIEAQLQCFPPEPTNATGAAPNLVKHLTHNVTADEATTTAASSGMPIINSSR